MKKFSKEALVPENDKWELAIKRCDDLYSRKDDIRGPFARDYTRVLHSLAYRRLKHKTQVFFNAAGNDHICTRIEHVQHVESVSNTIAKELGLNEELTRAIAIAHDLGHAPFGHQGEDVIKRLTQKYLEKDFWHEQNGVDLKGFDKKGKFQAATWEGCVVKLADKIAYLGRDIEDAIRLNYLSAKDKEFLQDMARVHNESAINTTVIMHNMIIDLCNSSSPETGLTLSKEMSKQLNEIKRFNETKIYNNPRLNTFKKYSELVLNEIFVILLEYYDKHGQDVIGWLSSNKFDGKDFVEGFCKWIVAYCDLDFSEMQWAEKIAQNCLNKKIYSDLSDRKKYIQAIIDYMAGMTDVYALNAFEELLKC